MVYHYTHTHTHTKHTPIAAVHMSKHTQYSNAFAYSRGIVQYSDCGAYELNSIGERFPFAGDSHLKFTAFYSISDRVIIKNNEQIFSIIHYNPITTLKV